MSRVPAVFSEGQLSTGNIAIVGPVPVGERWYVSRLDFANSSSADVEIMLSVRTGATNRRWRSAILDANGGFCEAIDRAIELEEGDMIMAQASADGAVDYYAGGIRESA